MKVFIVGGTGFTGPAVVEQLIQRGHDVTVFHRGQHRDERTAGAQVMPGDRKDSTQLAAAVRRVQPDVAVDMIPFTAADATGFMDACRGIVPRVVALSSIDVYLAFGRIKLTEPGSVQPTPLTERAALRETDRPGGPECDKIAVERIVMGDPDLPGTILRLPAIHGRGDRYRRFRCYLKPMDDGRRTILLGETMAGWKFSRGYVDNVAYAVVLAAEQEQAAGEIYNVAEPAALTEHELVEAIGVAANWPGRVTVLPDDRLPVHMQSDENFRQDWEVTSDKIRGALGYRELIDVTEGIRRTVEWERAYPPAEELCSFDYEAEDEMLHESGFS